MNVIDASLTTLFGSRCHMDHVRRHISSDLQLVPRPGTLFV
jgi:hypothetical protein